MVSTLILSLLFLILGLVHLNWVFGGSFGIDAALPTDQQGELKLQPRKFDTLVVALGLFTFSLFYLLQSELIVISYPKWIDSLLGYGIPGIFFLRAIGEFRYVGFFKKVKDTKFGKMDTLLFSPLCLVISVVGFYLVLKGN